MKNPPVGYRLVTDEERDLIRNLSSYLEVYPKFLMNIARYDTEKEEWFPPCQYKYLTDGSIYATKMDNNDLDIIIKEEYEFFSKISGFHSVGIGDGFIVLYVKSKKHQKQAPKEINGIPIYTAVMGTLKPGKDKK